MSLIKLKKVDHLPEGDLDIPDRLLPFIWFFVRQMKGQFLLVLTLFGLSNILVAAFPFTFKLFADAFKNVEEGANLFSEFVPLSIWVVLIFFIIQPIFAQVGVWFQAKTISHFGNLIRRQLGLYVHKHSFEFFQNDFAGRLAGKVIEAPSAIRQIVYTGLGAIWFAFVSYVVSLYLYITVHWSFAILSIFWIITYVILMTYFIPRIQNLSRKASENRSVVRGKFVDSLTNVMSVKLFARSDYEDRYFLSALKKNVAGFEKLDLELWKQWVWLEVITTFYWIATFWVCYLGWQKEWIGLSEIVLILPLTFQISNISWWMSEILSDFFQRFGEVEEGMQAIIKRHGVKDVEGAKSLEVNTAGITYNKVNFSYGSKQVFQDFDLEVKPGQKIGLVGPSGAGKSTFVQILLRLFDLQGGAIEIDGQNIAKVTQNSLREHISVIPQSTELLHRSVRENIAYGRLDATEDEIIEAARKAHAHDFIMELKDRDGNAGYDTKVGERGVKLSGGQRQRIAIARAILKDAPILILDEATSALDSESEKLIQGSLKDLMTGRTVIAIAHRLSTIAHLDRLIVMHEGEIVEDGSHEELLAKEGYYARLWGMQSGGFLGKTQD